jgi:hypothetical protein
MWFDPSLEPTLNGRGAFRHQCAGSTGHSDARYAGRLFKIAAAYERIADARVPPPGFGPLPD